MLNEFLDDVTKLLGNDTAGKVRRRLRRSTTLRQWKAVSLRTCCPNFTRNLGRGCRQAACVLMCMVRRLCISCLRPLYCSNKSCVHFCLELNLLSCRRRNRDGGSNGRGCDQTGEEDRRDERHGQKRPFRLKNEMQNLSNQMS